MTVASRPGSTTAALGTPLASAPGPAALVEPAGVLAPAFGAVVVRIPVVAVPLPNAAAVVAGVGSAIVPAACHAPRGPRVHVEGPTRTTADCPTSDSVATSATQVTSALLRSPWTSIVPIGRPSTSPLIWSARAAVDPTASGAVHAGGSATTTVGPNRDVKA